MHKWDTDKKAQLLLLLLFLPTISIVSKATNLLVFKLESQASNFRKIVIMYFVVKEKQQEEYESHMQMRGTYDLLRKRKDVPRDSKRQLMFPDTKCKVQADIGPRFFLGQ